MVTECIGFTLLYFKMAMMPLVPETKMADISKLISLENLLVRKVTWLVLTTTSATLILSRAFGADCVTRIAYIYSRLPSTHYLHFELQRHHTFSIWTYRDNTLSLSYIFMSSTQPPRKCIHSISFFFLVLPFRLDLLQPRTQSQKFRQTPKETTNQHGGKTHTFSHTLLYFFISLPYMKYLVHILFIVYRTLSIFSLFSYYPC